MRRFEDYAIFELGISLLVVSTLKNFAVETSRRRKSFGVVNHGTFVP